MKISASIVLLINVIQWPICGNLRRFADFLRRLLPAFVAGVRGVLGVC